MAVQRQFNFMDDGRVIQKLHYGLETRVACWVRTAIVGLEVPEMDVIDMAPKGISSRKLSNSIPVRKIIVTKIEKALRTRHLQRKKNWIEDHFHIIFRGFGLSF